MSDIIGFDSMEYFSPLSVENLHLLKVWVRSGDDLPSEIPCLPHLRNSSWSIPHHGSDVHFDYMPICVVPTVILLQ